MVFTNDKGTYTGIMRIGNTFTNVYVDTGAPYSVISKHFIKTMFNLDELKLDGLETIPLTAFGGQSIDFIPAYLRNVKLVDTVFDKFYFLLSTLDKESPLLIGWDFLNCGSCVSSINGDFNITTFDKGMYENYWSGLKIKPTEICNLH